jgi:transposase-like protein
MRIQRERQTEPSCPHCRQSMRFVRSIPQVEGLRELHTFECYPCSIAFTGEAVAEALDMGRRTLAA